jgi:predicted murein hydrolase (TIGR00659 family)
MKGEIFQLWVYLSATPLFGLTATLVAYLAAVKIHEYFGSRPIFNPVVIAVILLVILLSVTDMDYSTYFDGAQFIHFLLGPATVALAVPLYRQISKLRKVFFPLVTATLAGIISGSISAVYIADFLGATTETALSLAPKSVTAPVAMGIADAIGGLPSLTAILVVTTGVIGAIIGTRLFDLIGCNDDSVKGVAMGVTSHGIGTARAFQVSSEMGAFSGLAMALSALFTSMLLPWLLTLMGYL